MTVTLLKSLAPSDFETTLLLLRREGPYVEDVPEEVSVRELGARSLWTAWWPLSRWIRTTSPDIVFSIVSQRFFVSASSKICPGSPRIYVTPASLLRR